MGIFNRENNTKQIEHEVPVMEQQLLNRLYLVDYENVSDAGLVGVDKLTKADTVIIFYGSKVKTVAYESLIAITSSSAVIEHMKAEKTAKNYLDFQLTTYLGFKLGQNSYDAVYVISKDSGFDAVVDFWGNKGYAIKRQTAIVIEEKPVEETPAEKPKRTYNRNTSSHSRNKNTSRTGKPKIVTKPQPKKSKTSSRPTVTDKQKAEIRAALKGAELNAPDYKKVYDAFATSDSTSAYNNTLQKSLGNDKTSVVYKATSKIFENAKK
ncbi:PIN domain-containing protein [Pseudobutyrivibrio xylanivorans]|uniref:PIN-like domain-containing protein n=1 Tax=Pseudobutyrivibrio xylanivorans TaxID=185007 RepID=A0A5P6VPA7_PSEXY|nr:PIN domain-containing protein [Pseudobutyrivibrio xylanivorans]QFJ54242.1 hypothetical protein FXF36_04840 [Pseudobutyrivibrio xylanivorans]